jgi:hypothetical protein
VRSRECVLTYDIVLMSLLCATGCGGNSSQSSFRVVASHEVDEGKLIIRETPSGLDYGTYEYVFEPKQGNSIGPCYLGASVAPLPQMKVMAIGDGHVVACNAANEDTVYICVDSRNRKAYPGGKCTVETANEIVQRQYRQKAALKSLW